MSQVTISGKLSAEAALGETVTLTITGPNPQVLTAVTDASGNYSATYNETTAGDYTVTVTGTADATFLAPTPATATFHVSVLLPRTVSVTVVSVTS